MKTLSLNRPPPSRAVELRDGTYGFFLSPEDATLFRNSIALLDSLIQLNEFDVEKDSFYKQRFPRLKELARMVRHRDR